MTWVHERIDQNQWSVLLKKSMERPAAVFDVVCVSVYGTTPVVARAGEAAEVRWELTGK
jgi:hypothetical protein